MRIEDHSTVPAPAELVYDALTSPAVLARAIPGCERLIQLGPADAEGDASFEARVRSASGVWNVSLRTHGGRQHNRVELSLRARGAAGAYTGRGAITLVRHIGQTLLSYSLTVEGADGSGVEALDEAALREVARCCGEGLTRALSEPAEAEAGAVKGREAVALRGGAMGLQQVRQRAAWMVGGLLVGVAALALISNLARRLTARE
jgi:carbon monoxide dehydrogenase subunit G